MKYMCPSHCLKVFNLVGVDINNFFVSTHWLRIRAELTDWFFNCRHNGDRLIGICMIFNLICKLRCNFSTVCYSFCVDLNGCVPSGSDIGKIIFTGQLKKREVWPSSSTLYLKRKIQFCLMWWELKTSQIKSKLFPNNINCVYCIGNKLGYCAWFIHQFESW